MKRVIKVFVMFAVFSSMTTKVEAQCVVSAYSSADSIICGSCATLSAYGHGQGLTLFQENFNSGFPANWIFTNQIMWNNPCSQNGVDGTTHVWMGDSSGVPRIVRTPEIDLTPASAGITICFDMLLAEQADSTPCEGPDEPDEGIYIQYSIDYDTSWVTIHYFDPNGGFDPDMVNWRNWCFDVPPAAITDHTSFRWFQDNDSGTDFDHWGIDNFVIYAIDPTFQIVWQHDGYNLGASGGVDPNPVCPVSSTTYTVVMSNGTDTCSSQANVNVKMPQLSISVDGDTSICAGDCITLTGDAKVIVRGAKTPAYMNSGSTTVSSGNTSMNINITDLNMTVLQPGAITSVCINEFSFSGTQLCTSFTGCNCNGTIIPMGSTCNIDVGAFEVYLRSPDGCEIMLVPQFEATGTSYSDVCFVPVGGESITIPSFPSAGNWNPEESFSGLDSCTANGLWTMEFEGSGGFGSGSFSGWSISFNDPEISYQGDYYWQPTTNMTGSSTLTPTVCPTASTTYELIVADTAGCVSSSASAFVEIYDCCNITYTASVTQPTCGLNNGSIELVLSAGTYTFDWNNGDTTQSILNAGAGTYSVTITDSVSGCSLDTAFALINNGSPDITDVFSVSTCLGDSMGSASVTTSGGTPPYDYVWSSGHATSTATNLSAGFYFVTVADSIGCTDTISVEIMASDSLIVVAQVTDASASNIADGTIALTISGGTPDYSVVWNTADTTEIASNLYPGIYWFSVSDSNGCWVSDTVVVGFET
ncbi:MAG: hypothetical protein KKA07_04815 [Bacteroidetes bacterium]|nr:hypothetical protein [Bacteroidota bacterium]MBU1718373.1 hypothetical protein [Bacteroidota bacterium]